jgi:hypothetical protein
MATKTRKCNQCGTEYDGRRGQGGSCAREGDLQNFPFNGSTGVRAENAHWMHGAFCSDECYAAAYYEPPGC